MERLGTGLGRHRPPLAIDALRGTMHRIMLIRCCLGLVIAGIALVLAPAPGIGRPITGSMAQGNLATSALCGEALETTGKGHVFPQGLLLAISRVESGRFDPASGRVAPWPWTVQAEGESHYFQTKGDAVAWTREALARGVASIDVGCMQVNLFYHPAAFNGLDDAFDPHRNAEYAAQFLWKLHAASGDWQQAIGAYHSQTRTLAVVYAARVAEALRGMSAPQPDAPPPPPPLVTRLAAAWQATAPHAADPQQLKEDGWEALLRVRNKALLSRQCLAKCRYAAAGTFRKGGS